MLDNFEDIFNISSLNRTSITKVRFYDMPTLGCTEFIIDLWTLSIDMDSKWEMIQSSVHVC